MRRVTIALSGRALEALARVTERAEISQTEALDRAVRLYDYLDERQAEGAEITLTVNGEQQIIRII